MTRPAGIAAPSGAAAPGRGEYGMMEGLALVGDSLLVVLDAEHRRIVLFDTAGTHRRSFPVAGGALGLEHSFASFADGTIGIRAMSVAGARRTGRVPSSLVRYRLGGKCSTRSGCRRGRSVA